MKFTKLLLGYLFTLVLISSMNAQLPKKPSLMVVPSDTWMEKNGYIKPVENQGITENTLDYATAVKDERFVIALGQLDQLMQDNDMPIDKKLAQQIKNIRSQSVRDAAYETKSSGGRKFSLLDEINNTAKADILIYLDIMIRKNGPNTSVIFQIDGVDAYIGKSIATAGGIERINAYASVEALIVASVGDDMPNFVDRLQKRYDDILKNGREIELRVNVSDAWNKDLESEFNGEELQDIIENWVSEHAVARNYTVGEASEQLLLFNPVRIQTVDDTGTKPVDARNWARELSKFLKQQYAIASDVKMNGVGSISLTLGEK